MSNDKISALISLGVAILILLASYFQWYEILYDGYRAKIWVNWFITICIFALLIAGYYLVKK